MNWLDADQLSFPPYKSTSEDGIIALGGDLSPARLELAYNKGIFPWYNEDEPIIWWCPDPRFVLFPNELRVSKSMRKLLDKKTFRFSFNSHFEEVISQCQRIKRKNQNNTWIHPEIKESYIQLHQKGKAKSVEVWNQNNELVGGFYGVEVGNIFCGESMFSRESNASKAGFIHFIQNTEYELIDCQVYTQHLESLGAKVIPRSTFLKYIPLSGY